MKEGGRAAFEHSCVFVNITYPKYTREKSAVFEGVGH